MPLTSIQEVFLIGSLGGVLLELVHWWNLRRRNPRFPKYARAVGYWVITGLMAIAGGAVTVFYFGGQGEAIVALHVGISTPLILQKLVKWLRNGGQLRLRQMRQRSNCVRWCRIHPV